MYNEWFLYMSNTIQNGAGKNEFVFQFNCLQPPLYIKKYTRDALT